VLHVALAAKIEAVAPYQPYVSLDSPVALHRRGIGVGTGAAAGAGLGSGPDTWTRPGLKLVTWPAAMPARFGVCTAGSVRLPSALPDGGAWAFPGFPWMPAWLVKYRFVRRHLRGCVCTSAHGAAGSKQSAASPAISSLLFPAPLGSAATIALNWGV